MCARARERATLVAGRSVPNAARIHARLRWNVRTSKNDLSSARFAHRVEELRPAAPFLFRIVPCMRAHAHHLVIPLADNRDQADRARPNSRE